MKAKPITNEQDTQEQVLKESIIAGLHNPQDLQAAIVMAEILNPRFDK